MSYALFFSRGENGWGTGDAAIFGGIKVRFPTYLSSRSLLNESDITVQSLLDSNLSFYSNRFQTMAHLGQMYTVDGISCMIDSSLKYTRNNQDMITGGHRDDVENEDKSK